MLPNAGAARHDRALKAMPTLALLRHGPTDWNIARRIQGRSDVPLAALGREIVGRWRLAPEIVRYGWDASPLCRCRETAEILRANHPGAPPVSTDDRLIEMSFGSWEGRTLAELRAAHGAQMAAWESRGLDFRPPDGESPRDVQHRLTPWLADLAGGGDRLAITHKGVIRALHSLATGWDMRTKPIRSLANDALHLFTVDADGTLHLVQLNRLLDPGVPSAGSVA